VGLAVTAFAAIHSLLASRFAKERAVRWIGERNRNGLYRTFFNTQAVLTSGALVVYCARLRDRPLWQAPRPVARALGIVRVGILGLMYRAARQVGLSRMSGLHNLAQWRRGDLIIPPEPEAQGPALDRPIAGPFRFTRHPLNLFAIPLLWLAPRISRNRFAFNCAATLYFLIGSIHEEARLRRAAPGAYRAYQRKAPFMIGVF
jgi:protein-S-isoprenylcysteine O-methyltransferase Ste14